MRTTLSLLWMLILFVCTCTASLPSLIRHGVPVFRFTSQPRWNDLWIVKDNYDVSDIVQKAGHFFGFFLLALILTDFGQRRAGILGAIGYAVLTEILQLYFYRDGRIIDMFIDTCGILLAYGCCRGYQRLLKSPGFPRTR